MDRPLPTELGAEEYSPPRVAFEDNTVFVELLLSLDEPE